MGITVCAVLLCVYVCVSLVWRQDEQVPTWSRVRRTSACKTQLQLNNVGSNLNLLTWPTRKPRGHETPPPDPFNRCPTLFWKSNTGRLQSFRGRRCLIATVLTVAQAPKHSQSMGLMELMPTCIDINPLRQTARPWKSNSPGNRLPFTWVTVSGKPSWQIRGTLTLVFQTPIAVPAASHHHQRMFRSQSQTPREMAAAAFIFLMSFLGLPLLPSARWIKLETALFWTLWQDPHI